MQEEKDGTMEEEVIEEVIEVKPKDDDFVEEEDTKDDDDDFVEEQIIDDDDDDELRTIELEAFDCGECIELNNKKEELSAQINLVAGELERKKALLSRMMEKEMKLQEQFELKKQDLKMRYGLVDDYRWNINLFEGTAIGKRQETD